MLTPGDIFEKKMKAGSQKDIYTFTVIVALFTVAQRRKQVRIHPWVTELTKHVAYSMYSKYTLMPKHFKNLRFILGKDTLVPHKTLLHFEHTCSILLVTFWSSSGGSLSLVSSQGGIQIRWLLLLSTIQRTDGIITGVSSFSFTESGSAQLLVFPQGQDDHER